MRFNIFAAIFVAQGVFALPSIQRTERSLSCEMSPVPEICCNQQSLECIRDGNDSAACLEQKTKCVLELA